MSNIDFKVLDPAIPKGSLVLVTGANGFIGSHIVDQALHAGLKVRGTVRDRQKHRWLDSFFNDKYGSGTFELVEVKDITANGAFETALRDVKGVIHSASDLTFGPDPNKVVTGSIQATMEIVKEAAKVSGIKRFVYTSSSTAATLPAPDTERTIKADTWNDETVKAAWAPPPYEADRAFAVYGASKMQAEQALWKFVEEEKPGFIVNTVLPDTTFGAILSRENQGDPSTAGMPVHILTGGKEALEALSNMLPPQYFVDVQDIGRLHVIALLDPKVKNERLFGFAEPFNWDQVIDIFRANFPKRDLPEKLGLGKDIMKIEGRERAIELLREDYEVIKGFTDLETSLMNNVEAFKKDPNAKSMARAWS